MNIHVTDLKHGEIAVITNWGYPRVIGMIVQKYVNTLQVLSDNPKYDQWSSLDHIKNPECQVRVLRPGTTFKMTDKGLIIESEPAQPLFISEDGVEMFPSSPCYLWSTINEYNGHSEGDPVKTLGKHTYQNPETGWKIFHSKEARDQYANKHKTRVKTIDNVKIKLGDKYSRLNAKTFYTAFNLVCDENTNFNHPHDIYFSSIEKLEEYVKLNKIYRITEDGVELKYGNTYWYVNKNTLKLKEATINHIFELFDTENNLYFSNEYVVKQFLQNHQDDTQNVPGFEPTLKTNRAERIRKIKTTMFCSPEEIIENDAYRYIQSLPNSEYLHDDVIKIIKEAYIKGRKSNDTTKI